MDVLKYVSIALSSLSTIGSFSLNDVFNIIGIPVLSLNCFILFIVSVEIFLFIEVMAKAGVNAGLPPDLAMRLARSTVSGSGELARLSEEAPSQLRINVTSPGGTTAAALDVLMAEKGIQPIFDEAINAATIRSRELAG